MSPAAPSILPPLRLFLAVTLATWGVPVFGDIAVAPSILKPATPAEAWNVIRLAMANIDKLVQENRLTEITPQISLCSPALRALVKSAKTPDEVQTLTKETSRAFGWVNAIGRVSGEANPIATADALRAFKEILKELEQHYDAKVTQAEIFICPMHPDFISEQAKTPCGKCSMTLVPRRIPYSFIYTTPGEPSIRLTAKASAPCEQGKEVHVTVRLEHKDKKKSPVLSSDLMVMHTEPIHLLIEDPSLGDYHHEHPVPTSTPGEFTFSFTPGKTAPYRIWADIVPYETGLQELPYVDLPSTGQGGPVENQENRFNSTVDGYQFALTLEGGNHIAPTTNQVRKMSVVITDVNGQPVRKLEPVMNAFAHLVGFYADYQTVVHLHPAGGDILSSEARGGPGLNFQFFPPKPGFIRLYCQVSIDGKMLFAPLGVNVVAGP